MASYTYRIIVVDPKLGRVPQTHGDARTTLEGTGWTHETMLAFVHETEWSEGAPFTIEVDRRRGPRAEWKPHRRYAVDVTGRARRTDRTRLTPEQIKLQRQAAVNAGNGHRINLCDLALEGNASAIHYLENNPAR